MVPSPLATLEVSYYRRGVRVRLRSCDQPLLTFRGWVAVDDNRRKVE